MRILTDDAKQFVPAKMKVVYDTAHDQIILGIAIVFLEKQRGWGVGGFNQMRIKVIEVYHI